MTQGRGIGGIWPREPVENPKIGDTVLYPVNSEDATRSIARGVIEDIIVSRPISPCRFGIVYFVGGGWCNTSELSEDK